MPKVFNQVKIRSVSTDKVKNHKYANLNSITNDTSAYTNSLKKSIQYKIGLQNRTEDTSKFRTGLLSAGGNSNNNTNIKKFKLEEKPKIKSKSIYVNLQKEEEEDRELIELLEGKKDKSKKIFFYYY